MPATSSTGVCLCDVVPAVLSPPQGCRRSAPGAAGLKGHVRGLDTFERISAFHSEVGLLGKYNTYMGNFCEIVGRALQGEPESPSVSHRGLLTGSVTLGR